MKVNYHFLLFLCVFEFHILAQTPSNIGFQSGNLSFWEHVNGTYSGGASIYEGNYTGRTPTNPIPSKLSTSTLGTAFEILTADNTNSARDETISALQKVPVINGYRYTNAVKLGNNNTGAQADKMTYRLTVPTGVSSYNITYAFAMVLDDAGHDAESQPAFVANVLDLSRPVGQQKITCGSKAYNASTPGLITLGSIKYSNWQEVSFDLSQYGGKQIEINFQAMDCAYSGHFGYAYFALRSENFSGLLSGQSVICNNSGNLTYTTPAIDGATYNWTVPAGWTGTSTTNSITVNPNGNSGTISVTPSQSCGNIFSNSLNVTVANGVPADPGPITGTNTVCANGSVGSSNLSYSIDAVLNATEYEWTIPTGWTIIGGYGTRSITVNLASNASSGTMSVRAKNACGYSNTSSRTFTVLASQPSVGGSISPSSVDLSCPQSNTLTLSGVTGTVSKWESSTDGGFSWSEVSSSAGLSTLSVSPSSSAFYRAVVTNGSCPSAVSANSLINVKSPPNIVTQPFDNSICSGIATTFSVVASGDDLSYQWFVSTDGGSNFTAISNGGVYSGATSATLSLSSGINSSFNNYKYRVKVTNTCDNIGITSNTVGLYIYTTAYVNITSQPASVTVTQGSSTTLSVVAKGPDLSYQWKSSSDNVNFTNISGATSSTYRPSTSSTGYFYFKVDLSSSGCSGSASQTSNTATLWVKLLNQNPVAINDTKSLNEDASSATGNVLTNDSDPTRDAITVTQFVVAGLSGTFTAGQTATIIGVGTLQINANGDYTFVPVANYNGTAPTVTYTISDGDGATATTTLIITVSAVNDIPLAVNDTKSLNEDASSATGNVLTNDSDIEGDALSVTQFVVAGLSGTFTAGQTATIIGVGTLQINANGSYTFVPTANYNGSAPTVTYSISDGNGGTATATLIIRTDSANDKPLAVNDTKSLNEDASSATGNVLTNDSDVDGDAITVTQFVVAGLSGTFTAGQTATIIGVGTLQINANGSYTFVPTANYNGIAPTVTYSITDGFGGTGSATLIITVSSVNDIPLAVNDNFQLDGYNSFTSNVLTNDSDSDGDALSVTQFVVAGLSGTFNTGQTANIPNVGTLVIYTSGTFVFNPITTFGGNVPNVTYTVADTNNGVATAILAIVLLSDIDGDGTADYLDPDPNDGCVWDPAQRNIPTSIAWKSADCDGDGTPNGTDSAPLDYCVGRVGFTIPKLGTAAYNNYFKNSDCDGDGISNHAECNGADNPDDFDGDGIPNYLDTDSDNDMMSDRDERRIDSDGDGDADYLDLDSDNDGILDKLEGNADADGDGIKNYLDLDSDGDGIKDAWEAAGISEYHQDYNFDGRVSNADGSFPDGNGNGLADFLESSMGGKPRGPQDTDKDGIPDYLDLDSDGDSLLDSLEQTYDVDGDGRPNYRDLDSDGDWIADFIDGTMDTDADGTKNFMDLDSDGDGIPDRYEGSAACDNCTGLVDNNNNGWDDRKEMVNPAATDTDGDGTPDFKDTDSDNDGIPDSVEAGKDPSKPVDTDGDGTPDFRDTDSDNDGIPDSVEAGKDPNKPVDTDGDGKPDYQDTDSDNDGIPDSVEAGKDPNKPVDTDGDGKPDYQDTDSDNDGIPDSVEAGKDPSKPVDTDGDGKPDYQDTDSDNDGIPDSVEAGKDPSKPVDTDADGKPDYLDTDSDNDGIPDSVEAGKDPSKPVDTDADGKPDYLDTDSDNDGIPDSVEAGKDPNKPVDTDGDGKPDYQDTDSDNDGIPDSVEAGKDPNKPVDTDSDGKPDYLDTDSDNDGIPDSVEAGKDPLIPVDTDKDGIPDYRDLDSDGDGIPDKIEAGKDPSKPVDTDGDGKPDYQDTDSDNDGIPDAVEAGNVNNPVDTDGDGKPDYQDTDSDNDGIPDKIEAGADPTKPVDTDADGTPDYRDLDSDNDGYADKEEAGKDPSNPVDTDKDGKPDYQDTDSDNDGILDKLENDINYGALADCDKDGVDNRIDADQCPTFAPNGISPNGDGKNDVLIIPGILRNQPNELTIFNRWGNVVYQASNYKNDWGGQTDRAFSLLAGDNLLPDGTYYYVIDFFGKYPNVGTYVYINRQEK